MSGEPATTGNFRFLFRTDQGSIDRRTWQRGTLPIAVIGAVATGIWLLVRPYTHDALNQPPLAALLAYLYLLAFAFGTIILLICEYNLSAKRFFARGLPRSLAALLPIGLLLAGALDWYIPHSQGALPLWSIWVAYAIVLAILVWNIVELGIRGGR